MWSATLVLAGLLAGQSPEAADDIEGRWHLTVTLPIVQRAPLLGDTSRDFIMHGIVEVSGEEGALTQRTRPCAVELQGRGATRVEVPARFPEAIDVPRSPISFDGDRVGAALEGIRVSHRAEGTLPSDEGDPAVLDGDHDGEPGATVILHVLEMGEVKLFVVLSLDLELDGERTTDERTADERYEGAVTVRTFEQNILGSAPGLPVLDQVKTSGEDGRFTLERAPDDATCESL